MKISIAQVPLLLAVALTASMPRLAAAVEPPAPDRAELVMFESATCEWCRAWHAEIGPIYPKTSEAECAPLRRVDIARPRPDDLKDVAPVVFTPTFVVVANGHELARLVGYPGEDFFWSLLAEKLAPLGERCRH